MLPREFVKIGFILHRLGPQFARDTLVGNQNLREHGRVKGPLVLRKILVDFAGSDGVRNLRRRILSSSWTSQSSCERCCAASHSSVFAASYRSRRERKRVGFGLQFLVRNFDLRTGRRGSDERGVYRLPDKIQLPAEFRRGEQIVQADRFPVDLKGWNIAGVVH